MEQELYEGLRKGRQWALEAVCRENLKRSWYLCCQLAGEPAGGASLLLSAWKEALAAVKGMETLPSQDFAAILSEKIAALYQRGVALKPQYEALPQPRLAASYQALATEVEKLPSKLRPYYWLSVYGGATPQQLASAAGWEPDVLKERLAQGEKWLAQRRAAWSKSQRAAYVRASTQLRDAAGNGFGEVQVPSALLTDLWKECGLPVKPPKRRQKKPWTRKRLAAVGFAVGVGALLLAGGTVAAVLLLT